MLQIEKPKITPEESIDLYEATFVVEPLRRGFGLTIGNALRRTLLSALPGVAAKAIRINGVQHEFSTIKGVKEDVIDIVLNIKTLHIRPSNGELNEDVVLRLNKYTPGEVKASDIAFNDLVEIANPDLVICTLDEGGILEMEIIVGPGIGYCSADENKKYKEKSLDFIPVDSLFSPVTRVSYAVENARVGQNMDYDKLKLEVETNKTVTAKHVTSLAAKIIQDHTKLFVELIENMEKTEILKQNEEDGKAKILETSIEDMEFSVRSFNCLKRANINTLGDLVQKTKDEICKVRNMGAKSIEEVINKLQERGLSLRTDED